MAYSGKEFEKNFEDSWKKQLPNKSIIRLYDTTNGYRTIANPCDYLVGVDVGEVMLELKTIKESSFSFNNLTSNQFEQILDRSLYADNTNGGLLIYFRDKQNMLMYYPIEHIAQIKLSGTKSVNPVTNLNAGRSIKFNKKRVNIEVDCIDLLECFEYFYGKESDSYWGQEQNYLKSIYKKMK